MVDSSQVPLTHRSGEITATAKNIKVAGNLHLRVAPPESPVGFIDQDLAVFTYEVTNPGTTALSNVLVTDDRITDLSEVFEGSREPEVGIGETRVDFKCRLKMLAGVAPILLVKTLSSQAIQFTPLIELLL